MREIASLLAEIGEAKRVRTAGSPRSLAERRFLGAWAAIAAGAPVREVALTETAAALVAAKLGGIDADVLAAAGASDAALHRAFSEAAAAVPLRDELAAHVGAAVGAGEPPAFAVALAEQPRAGATSPGKPRLMLEPPESHGDHCWVTAVGAVLLATDDDIERPFLCGLAHHLHNARLPDAGFAGETLLGDELQPVIDAFTEQALAELTDPGPVRDALTLRDAAETPEAQAFHAADVLDRVLQMRHHARAAGFTLDQALDDLDLIHAGPLQAYGQAVVAEAGLA